MHIDLTIIIVNFNTGEYLKKCIRSIFQQKSKYNLNIFVIDNNSDDYSYSFITKDYPQVNLILNDKNLGFAAANNQALRQCKSDYILLLNPDAEIIDNAIDKMLDFLMTSEYQLLTCKLLNSDLSLQKSIYEFEVPFKVFFKKRVHQLKRILTKTQDYNSIRSNKFNHDRDSEIDWARGAVLMFSREVMGKIGLLDEDYYIYAEEEDYYLRAKRNGFKAFFLSNVMVVHHGKVSSKNFKTQLFLIGLKSRYIFFRKNYSYFQYLFYRSSLFLFYTFHFLRLKLLNRINRDEKEYDFFKKVFFWHLSKNSLLKINSNDKIKSSS
jgi:GT2 family glycosyltransferase